jgi:DivIVA domain-containing protein
MESSGTGSGVGLPLTPDEVRGRGFRLGVYGYRREEVQDFLQRVATDYELAIAAIAESASLPSRRDVDALVGALQEAGRDLRRAAALVALGDHSDVETVAHRLAQVMIQAADLLERAREWVRSGARPEEGPHHGSDDSPLPRPV